MTVGAIARKDMEGTQTYVSIFCGGGVSGGEKGEEGGEKGEEGGGEGGRR